MKGITHLAFGVVCAELLCQHCSFDMTVGDFALASTFCVAGALFPDIDQRQSKITNSTAVTKAIGKGTNAIFGHRGAIHTPVMGGLLAIAFYWLIGDIDLNSLIPFECFSPGIILYSLKMFYAGFLSHLFLDTLNPAGISWFYPISKKRISILPITSGGVVDTLLAGLSVFALLLLGSPVSPL